MTPEETCVMAFWETEDDEEQPRPRYGAIRWVGETDVDDAIRAVRACTSITEACRFLLDGFTVGESWAIVDLPSLTVVRRGTGRRWLRNSGSTRRAGYRADLSP
jgi:hypothetical protein